MAVVVTNNGVVCILRKEPSFNRELFDKICNQYKSNHKICEGGYVEGLYINYKKSLLKVVEEYQKELGVTYITNLVKEDTK